MTKARILNSKEVKGILNLAKEQWGIDTKLDYVFIRNEKDKIFIASRDISQVDFSKLNLNSIGMYFGQITKGSLRLSIEGSQILGGKAKKNTAEIDDKSALEWMKGYDIEVEGEYNGFVIIKNKSDYLGSGKFSKGKVLNFVSKPRRLGH